MKTEHFQLSNGLTVLVESNPGVYSVAVAFFVRAGARDETPENSGVSHFLEHMTFKGTERYTAEDVNRIFDEIGADSNAATGDEVTQYYAVCLPEFVPRAFDLLADIVYPSLREDDFDLEKNVILEEIGMYADQPAWVGYEELFDAHFDGHPIGQRILGTSESVSALTVDQMRDYHASRYKAGNLLLCVTGNITADEVRRLAESHCAGWPAGDVERNQSAVTPARVTRVVTRPQSLQQHVYELTPAPPPDSGLRPIASVLDCVVGDDNGSRLFWELVDPGRAEAADLGHMDFEGYGCTMFYLCCRPDEVAACLNAAHSIFDDVNANGVTEDELRRAKNKLASRMVLRSERPLGRLRSVADEWLYRGGTLTVDEELARIDNVTAADVRRLLEQYPLGHLTTATVGPLESLG